MFGPKKSTLDFQNTTLNNLNFWNLFWIIRKKNPSWPIPGVGPIILRKKIWSLKLTSTLKKLFWITLRKNRKRKKELLGKIKLTRKGKRNWSSKEWDRQALKMAKKLKVIINLLKTTIILIILSQQSTSNMSKLNLHLKNLRDWKKPRRVRKQTYQNKKRSSLGKNKSIKKTNFTSFNKLNSLKSQRNQKELKTIDISHRKNSWNYWSKIWRWKKIATIAKKNTIKRHKIKTRKEFTSSQSIISLLLTSTSWIH